jgi:hypothetical protein
LKKNNLEEITKILPSDEKIAAGEKRKGRDRTAREERKGRWRRPISDAEYLE